MTNIKLLFIITDEGFDKKVNYLLSRFGIKYKTISLANGTASPSILDFLGLAETKKNIFIAVIPDFLSEKIILKIKNSLKLNEIGTGIAWTIPISSSNKFLVDSFNKVEEGSKLMKNEAKDKYHLIITIVSEGYLEEIMGIAKKFGSSGGTVLKGRELANITSKKILGFNVALEKEIILNVVLEKDKKKIMEEITKIVGVKTKAKGICLSLPIEEVVGV